ncbi:hypothetical protein LWC34_41585 [Kibdelosporangium philippinense]|uniref:Uncharacterized protein n=1 Tax=Kibdelosporangium philippinense TaxID=211113 RepID=A0ABS8ZNC9_9PSEU|nr:hypothetical protein [Kibdelosporangium philippinense]MCE7009263.1 hypothetical protein [Kibdelosporangium philippinense]
MPVSSVVRRRCRELLPAGEQVRYMFPASSVAAMREYLIVVTDNTVTVLGCRWFSRHRPAGVLATYPRRTKLGPVELYGSLSPTVTLGPLLLEIDEEYVSVVRAADAEILTADYLPPDPLPDL